MSNEKSFKLKAFGGTGGNHPTDRIFSLKEFDVKKAKDTVTALTDENLKSLTINLEYALTLMEHPSDQTLGFTCQNETNEVTSSCSFFYGQSPDISSAVKSGISLSQSSQLPINPLNWSNRLRDELIQKTMLLCSKNRTMSNRKLTGQALSFDIAFQLSAGFLWKVGTLYSSKHPIESDHNAGPVSKMEYGVRCILEGLVGVLRVAQRLFNPGQPIPQKYHQLTKFVDEALEIMKKDIIPHCGPKYNKVNLSHHGIHHHRDHHHSSAKPTTTTVTPTAEDEKEEEVEKPKSEVDIFSFLSNELFTAMSKKFTSLFKSNFYNHRLTGQSGTVQASIDVNGGKLVARMSYGAMRESHSLHSSLKQFNGGHYSELSHSAILIINGLFELSTGIAEAQANPSGAVVDAVRLVPTAMDHLARLFEKSIVELHAIELKQIELPTFHARHSR